MDMLDVGKLLPPELSPPRFKNFRRWDWVAPKEGARWPPVGRRDPKVNSAF
jgi:hypothetical protein